MRISFLPEIENDIIAAYQWFESKSDGLGEDFLRVFYAEAAEIARMPRRYPKVLRQFRRALLRRFPYAVYFLIVEDKIIVYGVFHCARNPKWLEDLLDEREAKQSDKPDKSKSFS